MLRGLLCPEARHRGGGGHRGQRRGQSRGGWTAMLGGHAEEEGQPSAGVLRVVYKGTVQPRLGGNFKPTGGL